MSAIDVDRFISETEAPWPRDTLAAVVELIRSVGQFDESIKWGNPFFACRGSAVVKLFVARDWINVIFYRGSDLEDPDSRFDPAGRSKMRKVGLDQGDETFTVALRQLLNQAFSVAQA